MNYNSEHETSSSPPSGEYPAFEEKLSVQQERISTGNEEADELVAGLRKEMLTAGGANSDYEIIAAMIASSSDTIDNATKQCEAKLGMSEEVARERVVEVKDFLAGLSVEIQDCEIEQNVVTHAKAMLCEPILRGNMSAEVAKKTIKKLVIKPLSEIASMESEGQGYRGVMYCQPGDKTVTVASEVLTGKYCDENNQEITLNVRHMLGHEMSHVVVEEVFFQAENEANTEAMSFATEIIELAQRAKNESIPLPAHIETELNVLKDLETQYHNLPTNSNREKESFESFKKGREDRAAREILTDFTACYLQSDRSNRSSKDSMEGFMTECINLVGSFRMYKYMQNSSESRGDIQDRIRTYFNTKIEERPVASEAFPELSEAFKVYEKFYNIAQKYLNKDSLKMAMRSAGQGEDEHDGAQYGDSAEGFRTQTNPHGPQSKEESLGQVSMGLLRAFAGEVSKPFS